MRMFQIFRYSCWVGTSNHIHSQSQVRAALGGKLKLAISGAAPLPAELEEFMRTTLCCLAGQGYG